MSSRPNAPPAAVPPKPQGFSLLVNWRRLRTTFIAATLIGLPVKAGSLAPLGTVILRVWFVGLCAMLAFGIVEQWPKRLPNWTGRWVLQLLAVVLAIPLAGWAAYVLTTPLGLGFWRSPALLNGYRNLCFAGILLAPWIALGAMVRQREDFARGQALAFDHERGELERRALDARLHLLQAQVQPHFLFNTLANVQALVDAGSPLASKVLSSLIAYLRAAVPRLNRPMTTLQEEQRLVQAYLELMHLRMPDRLRYTIHVAPEAADLRCPPLTLLTLVENAVRHGIDPSEEGGQIDVSATVRAGRCVVRVSDTGVGLRPTGHEAGTGLATLRERLQLLFAGDAEQTMTAVEPHGVAVELNFPAQGN